MVSRRLRRRRGFTIIEVIIAVSMVVFGVLALVGSGAMVSRMLSRGSRATRAAFYAQDHVERLRATPCQLLADGSANYGAGYALSWTVQSLVSGTYRPARVIARYTGVLGSTRADTMEVTILCVR
jgi:Tfp pilus assembly protein PilV